MWGYLFSSEVIDLNFSDLRHCRFNHAEVWIVMTGKRCTLVNDFISGFCDNFVHYCVINGSRNDNTDHLRPEIQPIKDEFCLCSFITDITSLDDRIESLPLTGLFIEIVHLEPEEIPVVNNDFPDRVYVSESDDEISIVFCWERRERFEVTVDHTGMICFSAVGSARYVGTVLGG